MILPVRFAAEAELDLLYTAIWYDRDGLALGDDFLEMVDRCVEYLSAHPHIYQRIIDDVRRGLVHRFPYQVLYRINEEAIEVVAVLHSHVDWETVRERIVTSNP